MKIFSTSWKFAGDGTAYVPFFPLGGFTPLQSTTLSAVAQRLGATPMQVARIASKNNSLLRVRTT